MELEVYSIFDSKVGAFTQPFFRRNNGEAMRTFMNIVKEEKSDIHKYPEDFSLFHLASYNDEKGNFENLKAPLSMGLATAYMKPDLPPPPKPLEVSK